MTAYKMAKVIIETKYIFYTLHEFKKNTIASQQFCTLHFKEKTT